MTSIAQRPKGLTKIMVQDPDDPRSVSDALHRVQDSMLAVVNPTLRNPVSATPEAWIAPTLINAWVTYGGGFFSVGYYKDVGGVVHLRGSIKTGAIGAVAFVLPAGYRPSATGAWAVNSAGAYGACTVDAAGNVLPAVGNNAQFCFDGITFDTRA